LYWSSDAGVSVNLATGAASGGHATGDTLVGIHHLDGSAFDDRLVGDNGSNYIDGGAGNDTIDGGAGDDYLLGGAGNNLIFGGAGNDTLIGGADKDWLEGGAGADYINGGGGHGHALYWSSNAGVNVNLATGAASGGHA